MISILLQKILDQLKLLKTNIENLPSGGGFNYSTEEQKIGKWIDENDLYFKTIILDGTFTFNNDNWTNIVDLTSLNIDKIIRCDFIFEGSNELSFSDGRFRFSYSTTKMLRGATERGTSATNPIAIIYYTKSENEEP